MSWHAEIPLTRSFARFLRKPIPEKWAAVKATAGSAPARLERVLANRIAHKKRVQSVLVHSRAAAIEFKSGLGDSACLLYALARSLKPDVCVEIGSARGKSTCYIGMALKENCSGRLFAIDPHSETDWNDPDSVDSFDELQKNVVALGLLEQVTVIRTTSEEAAQGWDRSIDLLFIDGDHTYKGVKRDWELFMPFVKRFGMVVFHDTMWEFTPYNQLHYARADMGVPRFLDELRREGYPVITIDKDFGFTLVQPAIGGIPLLARSP